MRFSSQMLKTLLSSFMRGIRFHASSPNKWAHRRVMLQEIIINGKEKSTLQKFCFLEMEFYLYLMPMYILTWGIDLITTMTTKATKLHFHLNPNPGALHKPLHCLIRKCFNMLWMASARDISYSLIQSTYILSQDKRSSEIHLQEIIAMSL